MSSEYTRTGVRRSGDDYQDIVALDLIIEMLEHRGQMSSHAESYDKDLITCW